MTQRLIGNLNKGLIFIISAPAGTGKTTLVNKLVAEFPAIVENISYTTRLRRVGEVHGKDYYFIDQQEFESKISRNEFLEYVKLYGCYYGSTYDSIEALQMKGKHVILVIDTQGALQLKDKLSATFIFISPPSLKELSQRLTRRSTESESVIQERLEWAKHELEQMEHYDYCIINDNLDIAYEVLKSIIIAEEHRV